MFSVFLNPSFILSVFISGKETSLTMPHEKVPHRVVRKTFWDTGFLLTILHQRGLIFVLRTRRPSCLTVTIDLTGIRVFSTLMSKFRIRTTLSKCSLKVVAEEYLGVFGNLHPFKSAPNLYIVRFNLWVKQIWKFLIHSRSFLLNDVEVISCVWLNIL